MLHDKGSEKREFNTERLEAGLVVVGGGLAGVCGAITAARAGVKVVLIQDRPVLGGNASSEVRLWVLGATSHMGNNNRWAREGGVIDELLVENMYRNPEGNPLIFDTVLLEWVTNEPNITLLLNTAALDTQMSNGDTIESVRAFCSQNSTMYEVTAPLFCDASGDGVLGFLSGAAFRIGAEARDEFDEGMAPKKANQDLLGHSIYFYSKDVGKPVQFTKPAFALDDITKIPRFRSFNAKEYGCRLWWIEYGGKLDTVHETETIKWELWKVAYGVWDHIKNSGQFPEAENLTLEWVGTIPGKRESRRFEGDYMLHQKDLVEQREHHDAVSFGGWAIDLHPAEGVYSKKPGCEQWHSKGVYGVPYRTMYSKNVSNLFLAGRILSASHVAFGSTRVMATCAHNAQAVGVAAALCLQDGCSPRELSQPGKIESLQRELLRTGQFIPNLSTEDRDDLAAKAEVTCSSSLSLSELPANDRYAELDRSRGILIPVRPGPLPRMTFRVRVDEPMDIVVDLRSMGKAGNFTPEGIVASHVTHAVPPRTKAKPQMVVPEHAAETRAVDTVEADYTEIDIDFEIDIDRSQYMLLSFHANERVSIELSDARVTGLMSLEHMAHSAVSKGGAVQEPPEGSGVDRFEFWLPERRPGGQLPALQIDPPLDVFGPENVQRSPFRPTDSPNAWVANQSDKAPWLELTWTKPVTLDRVVVSFDTDHDHAMESVLMGHPERVMPFCVRTARLLNDQDEVIAVTRDHYQTRWVIDFDKPITTNRLRLECEHPSMDIPAAVFGVACYATR